MHDLIIIGAGPAGMTAAVYAARKKLDTLLLTKQFGGQPLETQAIENYMGYQYITGPELMKKFEEHMKQYEITDRITEVIAVNRDGGNFMVETKEGNYAARCVIVATGKRARKLNVPGERELTGKGVSYCTTCDGPLFAGQDVAVIGGGNSALQSAAEMSQIAQKVYLVSRGELTADPIIIEKIKAIDNLEILTGYETKEIKGNKFVEKIILQSRDDGQVKEILVSGIFVEIGLIPNSEIVGDLVKTNEHKEILVDCSCRTNVPGLFAAGDVTNVPEKQIVVAAGDGAKAAITAYAYLMHRR